MSERLLDLLDPLPEQLPSEGGRFARAAPQKRYSGRSIQEIADEARAAQVARARFLKDMAPEEQAQIVAELKAREAERAADPNRQRALELERAAQLARKRRCRRA